MVIRKIKSSDAENFLNLLKTLDSDTANMLYEPNERTLSIKALEKKLENSKTSELLTLVLDNGNQLVGYLFAQRGDVNRRKHTAYIVIGILQDYTHKGYGTKFFKELDKWATSNNILRLELTVLANNLPAINLYLKSGFKIEGKLESSMYTNGKFIDEYSMAKLIN
ncbi:MAG: GNAT family N-acetyltransferase [Sarcina sp.]